MMDNLGRFKRPAKAGQTPFTDTRDRCERIGYTSSRKRIAHLVAAGLQTQVARDELWDLIRQSDDDMLKDLPKIPALRRHLDNDLADIQNVSRMYASARAKLEYAIRERRKAQPSAVVEPPAPSGSGGESTPVEPEGSKK